MATTIIRNPLDDAPDLCKLSARALASAYQHGQLSPVEVVQATLERAHRVQTDFNAFSFIDAERALDAAKASAKRWQQGTALSLIDGIPSTLKDIVQVKDWVVRYGSRTTPVISSVEDAPSVKRLRAAGAVFIGQTTTPEFGWKALTDSPLCNVTRNPWSRELTSGGSSGGAAVAAACGAGVFHLGTDGGGSIRIPAAFTGTAGLKPTFGRVPAYPPSVFGTVAHIGPMARNTDDLREMLKVMSGRDAQDWAQGYGQLPALATGSVSIKGLRVGYWHTPPSGHTDEQIGSMVDGAAQMLTEKGALLERVSLPDFDLLDIFQKHWFSGAAARVSKVPYLDQPRLDPDLLRAVDIGLNYGASELAAAQTARAEFGVHMDAMLERFDVLISPATTVLPFACAKQVPIDSAQASWTEWAGFSYPINLSQQPACVIKLGHSTEGLPIGLQVIGGRGKDGFLLAVTEQLETMFAQELTT